jgi:RNA polymerase sigma-70 factor (ECF subfamily)
VQAKLMTEGLRGRNLTTMQLKSTPSHEALMARFQARLDPDAFEQIVAFYMNPALAVAGRLLSDHALAEDAVQEAFLRVIRKHHQYVPGSGFSGWFYAIVRNVCIDMLRKGARDKEAIDKIAPRVAPRALRTDSPQIPELLGLLPRGDQDVLVLRIVHGLRFHEVAAALGISEEAAKKRAQRALRRLRAMVLDSGSRPDELSVAI